MVRGTSLLRSLGQGATGNVYLADSSEGNVAIKAKRK